MVTRAVKGDRSQKDGAADAPFVRARKEWNDRYGDLARGKRNWQSVAMAMLAANLVLATALGWLATQSRITPYVVEVDALGQAQAFGPAEKLGPAEERLVRYQLSIYIRDLRTVLGDADAQRELLERAYLFTRGEAVGVLNQHFLDSNPFELARSERRKVKVESLLPLSKSNWSESSWQLQWTETRYGLAGGERGRVRYQAVLEVEQDPPITTETLLINPLGLYVTGISWTQLL